jgi:hypothetical protein
MDIPEYVTVAEVKRVCRELKISDWTEKKEPEVSSEEARALLGLLDAEGMDIDPEDFRAGLEVELEHGTMFKEANVTNNHPVLTAKIVLAHLKESLDYYKRLDVAELEGDLLKAVRNKDSAKMEKYYRKLAGAKLALAKDEAEKLS